MPWAQLVHDVRRLFVTSALNQTTGGDISSPQGQLERRLRNKSQSPNTLKGSPLLHTWNYLAQRSNRPTRRLFELQNVLCGVFETTRLCQSKESFKAVDIIVPAAEPNAFQLSKHLQWPLRRFDRSRSRSQDIFRFFFSFYDQPRGARSDRFQA